MSYKRRHKISLKFGLIIQQFLIQWWLKLETQGLYSSVQIWHVKKRKSIEINRSSVQQFSAGYVRNQSLNFWFVGQKLNFNAFPAEKLHLRAAFKRARVDFFGWRGFWADDYIKVLWSTSNIPSFLICNGVKDWGLDTCVARSSK